MLRGWKTEGGGLTDNRVLPAPGRRLVRRVRRQDARDIRALRALVGEEARLATDRYDRHDFRHPHPAPRAGEEVGVFTGCCGKLHRPSTHRHSHRSIICIYLYLQKMSKRLYCSQNLICGACVMANGNGPGGLAREQRLQIMLSPEELTAVDNFRFEHRMPSRAAAVRELFRIGLSAAGQVLNNAGIKSSEYGVLKAPKSATKHR
jgi:hypothetical protein